MYLRVKNDGRNVYWKTAIVLHSKTFEKLRLFGNPNSASVIAAIYPYTNNNKYRWGTILRINILYSDLTSRLVYIDRFFDVFYDASVRSNILYIGTII